MTDQYNNPEVYRPMGLDLPQTEINLKQSGAVLASALALTSVVAAGVARPEQASAQGVDCSAPSGEVSKPQAPSGVAGVDFSVDKPAITTQVCDGRPFTVKTNFRNYGTKGTFAMMSVTGRRDLMSSVTSIRVNGYNMPINDDQWGLNGYFYGCNKVTADVKDRTWLNSTIQYSCGRTYGQRIEPGEVVAFEVDISNVSKTLPKTGEKGPYVKLAVTDIPIGNEPYTEQTKKQSANNGIIRDILVKYDTGNYDPETNPDNTTKCSSPIANLVSKNSSSVVAIKARPGQTIKSIGNGASAKASERAKAARVSVVIPKGAKLPTKLPKNMRRIGNQVLVDVTKNISSNSYYQVKVPIKTRANTGLTGKVFTPAGTVAGCNKSTITYLKGIKQK